MSTIAAHVPRPLLVGAVVCSAAAANLVLGGGIAAGQRPALLGIGLGLLPALLLGFGMLLGSHRAMLAWIALALYFTSSATLTRALPLPGGTRIFLTDAILLVALGAWIASRLLGSGHTRPHKLSRAFGWPLGLLAVAVMTGVLEGHERYSSSIIAQPLRLVAYSAIALSLTDTDASTAWRVITRVFYAGAFVNAILATYYLTVGGSQTDQVALSTGGTRVLALGTAMYLTGSLVCALLNLELERRGGRQMLHVFVAGLSLFGIIVSFGRTTYAAVVLIVPLLLFTRRYMRRTVLVLLPLFAPVLVLIALVVPTVAPTVVPTLQARLSGTSTKDENVVWRERAREVTLEGVEEDWLTGIGFGRVTRFRLGREVVKIDGDPHNSFVYLLAGGGVLALGSFLLLCGVFVVDAVRRLRRAAPVGQALVLWSLATWLAFMVNAAAGPIFSEPVMLMTIWILMTLPSIVTVGTARSTVDQRSGSALEGISDPAASGSSASLSFRSRDP